MDIAHRIKVLRIENGLSQAALAKVISVSPGNVGDWERRKAKPSSKSLMTLCNYFKVSYNWFLNGDSKYNLESDKDSLQNTDSRFEFSLFICNISKFNLAKLANIDINIIDGIFHNKFPKPIVFIEICNILNISPEWLLGYNSNFKLNPINNFKNLKVKEINSKDMSQLDSTCLLKDIFEQRELTDTIENRIHVCLQYFGIENEFYTNLKLNGTTNLLNLYGLAHLFNVSLEWLISGKISTKSMTELEIQYSSYINDNFVTHLKYNDNKLNDPSLSNKQNDIKIKDLPNSNFSAHESSLIELYRILPRSEKEFIYDIINFRAMKYKNTKSVQ